MRALLAVGGAAAVLGAGLLVWAVRQQVAWSACQVHCPGRSPWPVTAVAILLLVGGGFFMAWIAAARQADRVLRSLGQDPDERDRGRRAGIARVLLATAAGADPAGDPDAGPAAARGGAAVSRRLAAVDVGSNTVIALVADLAGGRLVDVGQFEEMPELGAEVDRTGRIGPARTAEAIAALRTVVEPARRLGYEHLVAGATAAVRRAADGDAFLDRASEAIGVPVRLIGERREAELSFQGVAAVHAVERGWLMGDMGGGSTELVVAEGTRALRWTSLPVGSGGLASRYLSDPPRPGERETLRAAAADVLRGAPDCAAERLVMTGGTASHLPAVLSRDRPPLVLSAEQLRTSIERLDAGRAASLAPRYGLPEARVRALRAGAELLLLLLDRYRLDRFHVSHAGLRQGMILAHVERGDDWWR